MSRLRVAYLVGSQPLHHLLGDLDVGALIDPFPGVALPDFDGCARLLGDLRDGLPLAASLVWRTRLSPPDFAGPVGRLSSYLLVGARRLRAVRACLGLPTGAPDDARLPSSYDLWSGEIGEEVDLGSARIPLSCARDSLELLRVERALRREFSGRAQRDYLVELLHDFASRFFRCEVPVVSISTDDRDLLARMLSSFVAEPAEREVLARLVGSSRRTAEEDVPGAEAPTRSVRLPVFLDDTIELAVPVAARVLPLPGDLVSTPEEARPGYLAVGSVSGRSSGTYGLVEERRLSATTAPSPAVGFAGREGLARALRSALAEVDRLQDLAARALERDYQDRDPVTARQFGGPVEPCPVRPCGGGRPCRDHDPASYRANLDEHPPLAHERTDEPRRRSGAERGVDGARVERHEEVTEPAFADWFRARREDARLASAAGGDAPPPAPGGDSAPERARGEE